MGHKMSGIEMYIGGQKCSEAWKFIQRVKSDKSNNTIEVILQREWEEYYKGLLMEQRVEFKEQVEEIEVEGESVTTDIRVGKEATEKLKNGKASDPGGIVVEMVTSGTDKLIRLITQLFNLVLSKGEVPEEWKIGYTSSIHKKGDMGRCENYRGITVTSTFSHLYGRVLKTFIEEYKEREVEEQCGFRASRSCMDHIFFLTQIEKKVPTGRELHLFF